MPVYVHTVCWHLLLHVSWEQRKALIAQLCVKWGQKKKISPVGWPKLSMWKDTRGHILKNMSQGLGNGSALKDTHFTGRRPDFDSSTQVVGSQPPLTSALGDLMPGSSLLGTALCVHTHI